MALQRVVNHDIASDAIQNWNYKTLVSMLQQLKTYVDNTEKKNVADLTNLIDSAIKTVNSKISQLQTDLENVKSLAEVLTDAEKGQLEEILNKAFKTISEEGLLSRLCMTMPDGKKVSLKDVLVKINTRPEIVGVEEVWDENGKELISVNLTLTDGYSTRTEVMNRTKVQNVTDKDGNIIGKIFVFETDPKDNFYKLVYQYKVYVDMVPWINGKMEFHRLWEKSLPLIQIDFAPCPYTDTTDQAIDKATETAVQGTNQNTKAQTNTKQQQQSSTKQSNTKQSNTSSSNNSKSTPAVTGSDV